MEICVSCKTCKWRDDYSWVCFCPDSIHRADFTADDFVCDKWVECEMQEDVSE